MKHRKSNPVTYSLIHTLMASPTAPMPAAWRVHQLTSMWQGLASIETGSAPTINDWGVCSDAVNLMETLLAQGHVTDPQRLLQDAVTALALAGKRAVAGNPIRLDGPGIAAVRAVLEDYAAVLEQLPERTITQAHRATEQRIRAIHAGTRQAHDIEVIAL